MANARVAIIGAGPAGLVAARWMQQVGFVPVLFERASDVGGQWRAGDADSSVWRGMHTNTSRLTTAFSDRPHAPELPIYPRAEAIGDYLRDYAAHFGLAREARFGATVTEVEPHGAAWRVRWHEADGAAREESFARVVIASGRHRTPVLPTEPALDAFRGGGGVVHAAAYRGAAAFAGQRVLVGGHSVSAVEIASDLAAHGVDVVVSSRRHRFVMQRLPGGVPMEHRIYTRGAGLAWESLPPAHVGAWLKALIVRTSGHPTQYGALLHSEDVLTAGFTHSPHYLTLVAEGRIRTRPWMTEVAADRVHYADGSHDAVDTLLLATGYALDLPFLGPTARAALAPDRHDATWDAFTWHPALPGLACIGLYEHGGPFFPTLEQQARLIAYTWSGQAPMPSAAAQAERIVAAQATRGTHTVQRMHVLSRRFARLAGVEPHLADDPALARALCYGPLAPAQFRLTGPDALPDASARVAHDAAAFGVVTSPDFTHEEREELRLIAAARGDARLASLVG
ncbi:MAG: NAD(P)-binding domain-containing protein [Gemmatimonadaceae bacterium]|nr:NAD(P)-binding domain-containing protein [Gemmatimonadaceae bacterium]